MSHAPTVMLEALRPVSRRVMLVGIFALLVAAASVIPTHQAFGLFDPCHSAAAEDCWAGGDDGSGNHVEARNCSLHTGCVSIGVLPAGTAVTTAHGHGWNVGSHPVVADWTEFPTKPPPIVSL